MSASTWKSSEPGFSRGRRWLPWSLAGLFAFLAWGLFALWTPPAAVDSSICLLRRSTGLACPGCGMTRALGHLAKGETAAALSLHPAAPLLLAQVLAVWLAWAWHLGREGAGRRARPFFRPRWLLWLIGLDYAALLALWLWRFARGTLPP